MIKYSTNYLQKKKQVCMIVVLLTTETQGALRR